MNIRDEKLFKKLQIYFEMGQSIAIINPIDAHTKRIVQFFEKEILKSSDAIYVDFNAINPNYAIEIQFSPKTPVKSS